MGSPDIGDGSAYDPLTGRIRPTPPAPADDARPMVTGGGLIKFDRRADDATRESAPASGEVFVYRPASWKGQAPDDAKGRDDVKWVCRRADDAGGAEAAACVATAHDMAPRVVVEPYGRSEWRVWLHIGSASWAVGDPRHTKDAAERFAEPLRHALRAPLPAPDDAVEEAMAPGCHEHVALWDAINAYSVACGGHPTRGGGARMDAVVRVEKALRAALRREKGGDK